MNPDCTRSSSRSLRRCSRSSRHQGKSCVDVTLWCSRSGIRSWSFPPRERRSSLFRWRKRSSRSSRRARRTARFKILCVRDLGDRHCLISQTIYATVASISTDTTIPRSTTAILTEDTEEYVSVQARGIETIAAKSSMTFRRQPHRGAASPIVRAYGALRGLAQSLFRQLQRQVASSGPHYIVSILDFLPPCSQWARVAGTPLFAP